MKVEFITLLAWIFGVLSTALIVLRIVAWLNYSDIEKAIDNFRGYERTFPIGYPSIVSIVCWSWLITN